MKDEKDGKYFTARELKERLKNNDNRATARPYLLLLRNKRKIIVDGDFSGEKRWVENTSGDFHTADTKEELIKKIKSWHEDDEEFRIKDYSITSFYEDIFEETINVFLTDQGYKDHLKVNGHNLEDHDTYGIHAWRNKEMASLVNLIDENELLENKLHKIKAVLRSYLFNLTKRDSSISSHEEMYSSLEAITLKVLRIDRGKY